MSSLFDPFNIMAVLGAGVLSLVLGWKLRPLGRVITTAWGMAYGFAGGQYVWYSNTPAEHRAWIPILMVLVLGMWLVPFLLYSKLNRSVWEVEFDRRLTGGR